MAKEGIGIVITFSGVTEVFIKGGLESAKEYRDLYDDIKPYVEEFDKKVTERIKQIQDIKRNVHIVAEELTMPPEEKYWD